MNGGGEPEAAVAPIYQVVLARGGGICRADSLGRDGAGGLLPAMRRVVHGFGRSDSTQAAGRVCRRCKMIALPTMLTTD